MKTCDKKCHKVIKIIVIFLIGIVPILSFAVNPQKESMGYTEALTRAGLGALSGETYGNWFGPGWWGGSKSLSAPGDGAPVDSMDEIAMHHDFGYLVAEQQGKIFGKKEEYRLKAIADSIAAEEAEKLNEDVNKWEHKPQYASIAQINRNVMIKTFTVESPYYQMRENMGQKWENIESILELPFLFLKVSH